MATQQLQVFQYSFRIFEPAHPTKLAMPLCTLRIHVFVAPVKHVLSERHRQKAKGCILTALWPPSAPHISSARLCFTGRKLCGG
jgi:hypothetical protein